MELHKRTRRVTICMYTATAGELAGWSESVCEGTPSDRVGASLTWFYTRFSVRGPRSRPYQNIPVAESIRTSTPPAALIKLKKTAAA